MISITDGQIYLQDDLFKSGVRPAVDVGISVSRVGSAAQIKAMKGVAGTLKLDLAQFRDLEAFATFGSDLDAVSKEQLESGYRLVELLKQPLNAPMPVEDQVVVIFSGTARKDRVGGGKERLLLDIEVSQIKAFETALLDAFHSRYADLLAHIRDTGTLPDEARMLDAIEDVKVAFRAANAAEAATGTGTPDADAEALGDAESTKTLPTE